MRRTAPGLGSRLRDLGVAVSIGLVACAPAVAYRMPGSLRSYTMLVPASDSLGDQLAQAFGRRGLSVRRQIRGGGGPTAALVYFTFRAPEAGAPTWLHIRLADTRTGAIVGAAAVLVDSLPVTRDARADTILDSLGLRRRTTREP